MKKLVIAVVASLVAVATLPATPGLSLTPIGTLKTGPFRAEDPRAAEINAYDAARPADLRRQPAQRAVWTSSTPAIRPRPWPPAPC